MSCKGDGVNNFAKWVFSRPTNTVAATLLHVIIIVLIVMSPGFEERVIFLLIGFAGLVMFAIDSFLKFNNTKE
jgi:hypothetical protein